ncbi:hypothetical protein [Ligilactobacillus aviarius]|uniref:hypothetical protein n=1 Tax=Ligilactobacillus aviarius TaxID=1606 RepID=UPI0031E19204
MTELIDGFYFENFKIDKVHKIGRKKFVKYLNDDTGKLVVANRQDVPVDNFVNLVGEDWFSLLACFTMSPFLLENQVKSVAKPKGKMTSDDYVKLNNALYSLQSLGVLSKYEYDFNTLDGKKDVAYVLNDCRPLVDYFDDFSELQKHWKDKEIPAFERKKFLNWDNAARLFWKLIKNKIQTRLYNIDDPVLFFSYQNQAYEIVFGRGMSEHNFVSNNYGIPILNFYLEDYSGKHDPQTEICAWDLEKPMSEWLNNFDLEKWKNDRNTYLEEREERMEYRRKHKILGRFFG